MGSNFSPFPQYFQHIFLSKGQITCSFVKFGCSNYFFLDTTNLICRSTDISKCFRGSLRLRDNENRLYFKVGWLVVLGLTPFETIFQSISGRLPKRGRERRKDR